MSNPRFSPRRLFRAPLTLSLSIASAVLLLCPTAPAAVSVTAWGDNGALQCDVPPNLGDVLGIAGGGSHSLALLSNRHVAAWGFNQFGQTDVPPDLTNAIAVAAGSLHSLALRANGSVSSTSVSIGDGGYLAGQACLKLEASRARASACFDGIV
jgi:alpha-tubulin suppressor-like RCC1 family protein